MQRWMQWLIRIWGRGWAVSVSWGMVALCHMGACGCCSSVPNGTAWDGGVFPIVTGRALVCHHLAPFSGLPEFLRTS